MKKHNSIFLLLPLILVAFAGCMKNDHETQPSTVYGSAVAVGGDSARSFMEISANGLLTSVGVELGVNALNGLPTDTSGGMPDFMYSIPLPANSPSTGIDH